MTKRAAIYTRISDAREGETAGIDRQRADCLALAERRGYEVAGVYEDNNVSAMKKALAKRTAGARLIADIGEGRIDVVLAYSAERLYRRVGEIDSLIDQLGGAPVETVVSGVVDLSTADGRMIARHLSVAAQHESEKRGERVSRAAVERAKQGLYNGGMRRFGYTKDAAELVPEEAKALRWAYGQIRDGASLQSVTNALRDRGIVGSRGASLTTVALRDALLRPMNAGLAFYKGTEVGRTNGPVIVDEDTWRIARAILTDPRRVTSRGKPATTMLAPVLRCGVCGGRCTGTYRRHSAKNVKTPIYRCHEGAHVSRSRLRLDEAVWELVTAYVERNAAKLSRPSSPKAPRASMDADKLRQRLDELAQVFASGVLDAADYAAATREARARLAALEGQIAESVGLPATASAIASGDVREAMQAMATDARRSVVKELIERIDLDPGVQRRGETMEGVHIKWRDVSLMN